MDFGDSATGPLADLEDRVRRAAELIAKLRAERDAALAELDKVKKAGGSAGAESEKLRVELQSLRAERTQVRARIETLLGQLDLT